MNGHVYQTFNESDDKRQFGKTTEALGRWINMNTKNSGDLMALYTDLRDPTTAITRPENLDAADADDPIEQLLWKETVKDYITRRRSLVDNLRAVYSVIWGQCSPTMKAKLMSLTNYEAQSRACDCVWLLQQIKAVMYKFEGQRDIFLAMGDARSTLDRCKQQPHESNAVYFDQFKSLVDAFEHYGGTIGGDKGLIDSLTDPDATDHPGPIPTGFGADEVRAWILLDARYKKKLLKQSRDQTLAMMYLSTVDRKKYGDLWVSLQNQHSRGNPQYPKDLSAAYSMVAAHKSEQPTRPTRDPDSTGLSFLQSATPVPGTDGVLHANITCFQCNIKGHFASVCPSADVTGVGLLQIGDDTNDSWNPDDDCVYAVMFTQVNDRYDVIPPYWILLDSQSTVCVFRTARFLRNIRASNKRLHLITNGGSQTSNMVGDLSNFGEV
jgi:hypothetical protein